MEGLNFSHGTIPVYSNNNLVDEFNYQESTTPLFLPTNLDHPSDSSTSSKPGLEGDTCNISDCNDPMLKYISDILLEGNLEGKPCMLQDNLAFQATEKSFYDALKQKENPPLFNQPPFSVHQSFENSDGGCHRSNGSIADFHISNSSTAAKTGWLWDFSDPSHVKASLVESVSDTLLVSDSFSDMQNHENLRGVGEGIKFLPSGKFETIDLERCHLMRQGSDLWRPGPKTLIMNFASEPDNDCYISTNRLKGKKNHRREDDHYTEEGRSNKQSATSAGYSDMQEMFDKGILSEGVNHESESGSHYESLKTEASRKLQCNKQSKGSQTTVSRRRNERQVVDLCKLLTECAQAVASSDQQSASELLEQIRQHSSPYGNATQRLAHYFADGLEARLDTARIPPYSPPFNYDTKTATEILKAYQVYVTSCPYKKMVHCFANRTIMKQAEKATRLHIIDFGISHGFQWPCLIQSLSEKTGGPPTLRITAIELPQPGFRPAEEIEETGRRLARYSKRFNVPFEYSFIAKKWETIQLEDLQFDRNEVTVVNCMHRLKHMPDETVMDNNPRDAVLSLIKRINPDLFMHGIVNGTYNSPVFLTRFKQALNHFYAFFDMYEATVPREDEQRLSFERAIYGGDIMNVIACEGIERVERPETYKQWQARYLRAGFMQLPLDQELLKKVKTMSKVMGYHAGFRIEEDGDWMLQGWKGRIVIGLTALKPA